MSKPLDVWLKFDSPEDEEPALEANTYQSPMGYYVEWYHTGVGLVSREGFFPTYEQATAVLEERGYQDFSS